MSRLPLNLAARSNTAASGSEQGELSTFFISALQ